MRQTSKHLYFPEPLDEKKEQKYLLEPLVTSQHFETVHETSKYVISYIRSTAPVLQNGPMCGLVAMTMASELLDTSSVGVKSNTHPECILEFAKQRGFTKQGEIFSTQYMQHIIQEYLAMGAEILQIQSLSEMKLIELLLSTSKTMLVPYDADKNHSPCLAGGHKAHWCVLVGFAVCLATDGTNRAALQQCTQKSADNLLLLKSNSKEQFVEMLLSGKCHVNGVYVFARHGKSRYMGLWNWNELRRSNENLLGIDPQRTQPGEYVIPTPGGIREGLCSQIVTLYI